MRKLLLASAAMLGGTMVLATGASAQNLATNVPANATAISSPSFSTATPATSPMAASTMTVRLGGRLNFEMFATGDSGQNAKGASQKLAPYTFAEYARLYPSFDAVAANGLRYGAALEIRQDNGASAGGGAGSSVSGSTASRGSLYFRREMGYFGADKFGFLRFGATDQPTSLFATGTMENFDMGGWNGDLEGFTGRTQPAWAFPDQGALYTTTKVVYVSPKFFNMVDFGVSFEPGTGTVSGSSGQCNSGYDTTAYCDATSSSSIANENKRRRNTVDGVVRLRTAIGPVGLTATVGGMKSGKVLYNGTVASTQQYNGLEVLDAGLQVTWGGLAVGGHVDYGEFNAGYNLSPKGGRKSLAYLAGASYSIGPAVFGVQAMDFQNPGSWNQASNSSVGRTRNEWGIGAGSTVTVAPGAYVYLSYLYGHRHQAGVDILTGTNGAVTHNNVQSQGVVLGTMLKW